MTDWTKTWPSKPGWYWFYGFRYQPGPSDKPKMIPVEVRTTGNGTPVYVAGNSFMYRREGADGWWVEAIIPTLPGEISQPE